MTKCAELINSHATVDFVDINTGCPIDLVFKKVNLYRSVMALCEENEKLLVRLSRLCKIWASGIANLKGNRIIPMCAKVHKLEKHNHF